MFLGEYKHNLDAKNRLIIPSKFRDQLKDEFIITKGNDKCLNIYTMEQWQVIYNDLEKLVMAKKINRQYKHSFTSKAVECKCDSLGRIQLPPNLVALINIQKECVIVGEGNYASIWAKEEYEIFDAEIYENYESISETVVVDE